MKDLVKIVVTVPTNEADVLRKVLGDSGGGKIGEYTYCSFSVKGKGRFLPNEGSSPTIGAVGKPEIVEEERIEITCNMTNAKKVIDSIRETHSYEEPAIDVYPLLDLD